MIVTLVGSGTLARLMPLAAAKESSALKSATLTSDWLVFGLARILIEIFRQ